MEEPIWGEIGAPDARVAGRFSLRIPEAMGEFWVRSFVKRTALLV
ncbi:hypothetical protein PSQ20_14415 [Curvibacter sp. RS43]|nr:hypothetical protein [Curvibacter sp. RS43]MDD0811547.1 hypothetical protein [Curvibacter sp. RS43]